MENIRSAIDKAKSVVEQFKSLSKAQQIKLSPLWLKTILENSVRVACNKHIACEIECDEHLKVLGDEERLIECFDELVANSLHWFKNSSPRIKINARVAPKGSLPDSLDSSKDYILLHYLDNGCGIEIENKSKIFNAFFTTYQHGTGLGLALVRQIIEGHKGYVSEVGIPGEGVDFEIFLELGN